jgi:hypothetical protein
MQSAHVVALSRLHERRQRVLAIEARQTHDEATNNLFFVSKLSVWLSIAPTLSATGPNPAKLIMSVYSLP